MPDPRLNILIVEDDPIIAEDLNALLVESGYTIVAVVHDAIHAYLELDRGKVDFAILDIHLGDGPSGITIAEAIHTKYHIPYVFLTSFYDDATLSEAKQFSPYGYLVKPFQERTLLTTIKIALTNFQSSQEQSEISKDFAESKIQSSFTDQEFKILTLLIKGNSYKQIATSIDISPNTVKYHAGNIYIKCDIKSRGALISLFT